MQLPQSSVLLAIAVAGAGGYALLHDAPPAEVPYAAAANQPRAPLDDTPGLEETDPPDEDDPEGQGDPAEPVAPDDRPAIAWTVPSAWRPVPNPSPMRIATYDVAHVAGDTVDGEVSISRAGGDVDSNVERWAGQFSGGSRPKRLLSLVHGFEVTFVDIEGNYTSTMEPAAAPQVGWALAAAIVKTPGLPYFFKMTGPAATVRAAKAALRGVIESVRAAGRP
jgi:hypothetical protein